MRSESLPESVQCLAAVIGLAPVLALVKRFPGQSFRIANVATPAMKVLGSAIGPAQLGRLVEAYKGSTIYLPMLTRSLREARNKEILDNVTDAEKSTSTTAAVSAEAVKYKLSERTIWRVLSCKRDR